MNKTQLSEYEQFLKIKNLNRSEKRKLAKKMKIAYTDLIDALDFKIENVTIEELPEGTLVKLKADEILKTKKTEKYLNWVRENADKVFTVERIPDFPKDTKRCVLKEDTTYPKWIFHISDLELVLDTNIISS